MYRVELPGPKVTKDIATDAKVRLEIPRAKFDFDAAGHYHRPDVLELRVRPLRGGTAA